MADITVTTAKTDPKVVLEICKESIQKGTNREIKNVWPKEEKKLNRKPKFSSRLLPPINN